VAGGGGVHGDEELKMLVCKFWKDWETGKIEPNARSFDASMAPALIPLGCSRTTRPSCRGLGEAAVARCYMLPLHGRQQRQRANEQTLHQQDQKKSQVEEAKPADDKTNAP
jgi:hypothetical protein